MEGTVHMRRETLDWMWTERYLVLHSSTLLVFKRRGDPSPRRTLVLTGDCFVAEVASGDHKYHDFKLSFGGENRLSTSSASSQSSVTPGGRSVRFATKNKEETQRWVRIIDDHLQRLRFDESEKEQSATSTSKGIDHTPAQIQNILNKKLRSTSHAEAVAPVIDCSSLESAEPSFAEDKTPGNPYSTEPPPSPGDWELVDSDSGIATYRHCKENLRDMITRHAKEYNLLLKHAVLLFAATFVISYIAIGLVFTHIFLPHRGLSALLVAVISTVGLVSTRYTRLLVDPEVPQYLASVAVRGTPESVFRELTTAGTAHWVIPFGNGEELEHVNEYADICYHQASPVWMFVAYSRPRDMVVLRYWRQEEDGSYFVIFQSTSHPKAPPRPGFVRANIPLSSVIIYPQRAEAAGRGARQSMVTLLCSYDPGGWGATWARYMNSLAFVKPVMYSLVAFKDALAQKDFIDPHLTLESKGSGQASVGVDDQGLVVGVKTLPCSCPLKFWAEPDAAKFEVRGPHYLKDKVKVVAGPAAFHLVAVDMLSFEDPSQRYNLGARPDNLMADMERDAFDSGNPTPFTLIINMVIPCALNLCAVCYFQPADPNWRTNRSPFMDLFLDFIDGDDAFRNSRFKLIPTIVEGSFILRKALGAKPALIGNKGLRIPYHRGENWFEVDIDVDSDSQARNITGMVIGATKGLVVDIAFLIESQTQEELPETILGAVRFNRVDTSVCKRIAKDLPTTRQRDTGMNRVPSTSRHRSQTPIITTTLPSTKELDFMPELNGSPSPQKQKSRHARSLSNTPILSRFRDKEKAKPSLPTAHSDTHLPGLAVPALTTNTPMRSIPSVKAATSVPDSGRPAIPAAKRISSDLGKHSLLSPDNRRTSLF